MSEVFFIPFNTVFNTRSLPAGAAKVYFYLSGTTTFQAVYADAALTVQLENPVVADAYGSMPVIYMPDNEVYRVRITDKNGSPIGDDIDPYVPGTVAAGPTGPVDSTYLSLVLLKAAPASNRSYKLVTDVGGLVNYAYVTGDFTGKDDESSVVKLNSVPLTTGALVRQGAASISVTGGGTVQGFLTALSGATGAQKVGRTATGTGAILRTLDDVIEDFGKSVKDYGAKGDGVTNDYQAFLNCLAACLTTGAKMIIPPGVYLWDLTAFGGTAAWDVTRTSSGAARAIQIEGSGVGQTSINITNAVGVGWRLYSAASDAFDISVTNLRVFGQVAGPLTVIGQDLLSDAENVVHLENFSSENSANSTVNEALRLNYIAVGQFTNVRANAYADSGTARNGTGIRIRAGGILTFAGGSYGNAKRSVWFTDGFSYNTTWISNTFENSETAIQHDTASGGGHIFLGPQITECTLYGVSCTGIIGSKTILLESPNFAAKSGTSAVLVDPSNYNGIVVRDRETVTTPSVPGSGATYTNNMGRTVEVKIWGGSVSVLNDNGSNIGIVAPAGTLITHTLKPGEYVALTYSSTPTWRFKNVSF